MLLESRASIKITIQRGGRKEKRNLISHRPISVSISKSMANTATKTSTFAVTCGLLSQYVKEKGARSLGDLGFSSPLAGKSDTYRTPTTMSLLPGMEVSGDIPAETKHGVSGAMELFPQRAGLGLNVPAGLTREPEKAQLTIFYGGKVLVFDNFPSDKASDLMQLARKKSCTANNIGVAPPTAAAAAAVMTEAKNVTSNQSSSTTPVSAPTNSLPIVKTEPQKAARGTVSNVPMARKASLHRFLEKRNDRINAKAPYQVKDCPSKDSPVDSAKAAGSQPWLGLKTKPET
ncbi:pnFL-2 [Iris pallida]|uniref:Protein TIFY n=1 Tax=Iris pallida TaxID=29817 RepID=A0AAX6I538_IRIPA|nr:pnFL-2 [Iris pallida]